MFTDDKLTTDIIHAHVYNNSTEWITVHVQCNLTPWD